MRSCLMSSLLLMMLLGAASAGAQQSPPLFIAGAPDGNFRSTDLYRYTGSLEPVTEDSLKSSFQISSTHIVYRTAPENVREAIANGDSFLYGVAWDIEVYDIASGERTTIAAQPKGATYSAGQINGAIIRTDPVWSPDGTRIAWTEQGDPEANPGPRLMIHDLTSHTTRTLDDALPAMIMSEIGLPGRAAWGWPGIAIFTNNPGSAGVGTLRLYDPETGLIDSIDIGQMQPKDGTSLAPPVNGPLWVQDGTVNFLAVQLSDQRWYRVDPQTRTITPLQDTLELVSAVTPDTSLRVAWMPTGNGDYMWQLMSSAGEVLHTWRPASVSLYAVPLTIAPTGDAVAFMHEGMNIWQDNTLTQVDMGTLTQSLRPLWGPVAWRVAE